MSGPPEVKPLVDSMKFTCGSPVKIKSPETKFWVFQTTISRRLQEAVSVKDQVHQKKDVDKHNRVYKAEKERQIERNMGEEY